VNLFRVPAQLRKAKAKLAAKFSRIADIDAAAQKAATLKSRLNELKPWRLGRNASHVGKA
jgi:hypothetical protein